MLSSSILTAAELSNSMSIMIRSLTEANRSCWWIKSNTSLCPSLHVYNTLVTGLQTSYTLHQGSANFLGSRSRYCKPLTNLLWASSSSGACLRRRSRCHEFPPSRSILSASLHSRQSKIHRLQVGLHGSEPGLPWTTNPPSPVVRWVHYAGLESPVMILPGVKSNQIKIYIAPLYRV